MLGSADNLERYSGEYGNKATTQESHSNLHLNEARSFTVPDSVGCIPTLLPVDPNYRRNTVQSSQVVETHVPAFEPKDNSDATEQHFIHKHTSNKHAVSTKSTTPDRLPSESETVTNSPDYPIAFSSYQPYNTRAEQNLPAYEPIRPFTFSHTNEGTTRSYNADHLSDTFGGTNVATQNSRYAQGLDGTYQTSHNTELEPNQPSHFSCDRFVSNSCGDCLCVFSKCNSTGLAKSCCYPIRFFWSFSPALRCHTCWPRRRLPNESMLILSVIQLLCGFAAIILSSVGFTKAIFLHQIATGLWAGVIMLITGFHGLIAARRPVMCTLVGLLALCLIVSLAACVLICVSVAGTIEDGFLDKTNVRLTISREPVKLLSVVRKNFSVITSDFNLHEYPQTVTTIIPRKMSRNYVRLVELDSKVPALSDAHQRTYQIILHLLLLLVGILEASVSLATSILCCRCVCSRPVNFALRNSRSLRTNIVSFNVATANQAASLLRSGAATNFVGTGNVLLAVSTESRKDGNALFNFLDPNRQIPRPYIHHTLVPFLSDLNERSLILTHAGTGSLAWTAARAAANLVTSRSNDSPDQPIISVDIPNNCQSEPVVNQPAVRRCRSNRRRPRILCSSQPDRPRLLYTSFHTPVSQTTSDLPQTDTSFPDPPPFSPRSTLVYVMPSPTRDDPPMIFPPFPPSYNDLQKRPLLSSSVDHTPQSFSGSTEPRRTDCRDNPSPLQSQLQTIPHNQTIRRRLSRVISRTRRRTGRRRNLLSNCPSRTSRSTASAPIPAGDRFIQPVLIIEDPALLTSNNLPDDPPPKYSSYAK